METQNVFFLGHVVAIEEDLDPLEIVIMVAVAVVDETLLLLVLVYVNRDGI